MNKGTFEKWEIRIITVLTTLALLVIIFPHLWMGLYAFPQGDDFSFSANNYHAVQEGGFFHVLKSIFWDNPIDWSNKWEGRWAGPLLVGMNPAIFGMGAYKLCVFISFLALIGSQYYFFWTLFGKKGSLSKGGNRLYILAATEILLIMEILYVPYPTSTFFWWTGIAAYTLPFCAFLILFSMVFKRMRAEEPLKIYKMIGPMLLSFLLGGTNFSVSILTFSSLVMLFLMHVWYDLKVKKNKALLKKNAFVTFLCIAAFLIGLGLVFLSPAMKLQLSQRYGGEIQNGFFASLTDAIVKTLRDLVGFFKLRNIIFCLLLLPFAVVITERMELSFPHPLVVLVGSILLLASQISVNMLVDGTIGGEYAQDIWFYSIYIVVVGNELLGTGLVVQKWKLKLKKGRLLCCTAVLAVSLLAIIYVRDFRSLSSYQAYNYVNNGYSQAYAAQWKERIEVLEDDGNKSPAFEPIRVYGGYIEVYDLYPQGDVAYWINEAIAEYYGKDAVYLKE